MHPTQVAIQIRSNGANQLLEIYTLGELGLKLDGQPIEFATRKVEALLVYLACSGQPCPREVLAELLWQDRSQAQSQANFRAALSRLNQKLASYLTVTRQTVTLHGDQLWLDTAKLDSCLAAEAWEEALALYHGDFLAGFSVRASQGFDDWVWLERERLKKRVIEALDKLIQIDLNRNNATTGIARCYRLLQLDPLREETYIPLMRLLAGSGQRAAALAQYETCRRLLADELAVEPGVELTALYHQLQAGELPRALEPERAKVKFINPLPQVVGSRYVGNIQRQAELAKALAGEARLVSVYGRGGVGKTALACKVLSDVGTHFAGVISLSAQNTGLRLDRLLSDFGRLLGGQASALLDAAARDSQMTPVQKVSVLLEQLRGERCLLFLDNLETRQDAHTGELADSELQTFVEMALAQSSTLSLLITSREPLELPRSLKTWEYRLSLTEGLAVNEAVTLLRAFDPSGVAGLRDGPEEALRRIAETVFGFPRALEAVAGLLLENPLLSLDDILRGSALVSREITPTIVEQAIAHLKPEAIRVLEALAVFGRPVSQAALEFLLAPYANISDLRAIVSKLTRTFFVNFNKTSHEFSIHPIDQAYCYSRIPESGDYTLATLHHRAANYYQHQRRPQSEWQSVSDLTPHLTEIEHRVWAGEYDAAAEVLLAIDRDYLWEWGQKTLLAELHGRLQGHITDPHLARASRRRLAWTYWPDVPKAAANFSENLVGARQAGDRQAEADALDDLAQASRFHGNMVHAGELHEQALAIYREIGDRRGEGDALGGVAQACMGMGQIERALVYDEQALEIQRELNNQPSIGFVLWALGGIYRTLGQFDRAIACHTAALGVYGEINAARGIANNLSALSITYANVGEFEKAFEEIRKAHDIYHAIQSQEDEVMAQVFRGVILAMKGDLREALQVFQSAQATDIRNMLTLGFANQFSIYALIILGEIVEARALSASLPMPLMLHASVFRKLQDAIITARLGERDAAHTLFRSVLERTNQLGSVKPDHFEILYRRGLAEAGLACLDQDQMWLQKALADYTAAYKKCAAVGIRTVQLKLLEALMACPGGDFLQPARAMLLDPH